MKPAACMILLYGFRTFLPMTSAAHRAGRTFTPTGGSTLFDVPYHGTRNAKNNGDHDKERYDCSNVSQKPRHLTVTFFFKVVASL